jgi:predicted dehydrogenase
MTSPSAAPLRVGLIGLSASGGWGAMAHVPAIEAVDGVTLTALAASSPGSARAAADEFSVEHAFSSVEDLARCDEVDLVVVAVKVPQHKELLLPVLPVGKPVLCEWPLARTVVEAQELVDAAGDARTFIGLQARASPAVRYLRDLVADGYVGTVLSTTLVASGPQWGRPVDDRSAYAVDIDQGATMVRIPFGHTIDGMSMVLGDVTSVHATTATRRPHVLNSDSGTTVPMTAHDQLAVGGTMGDGIVLSVHYRGGRPRGPAFEWRIHGTEGDLLVTTPSGSLQVGAVAISGGRADERGLTELPVPAEYDAFEALAGTPAHNVAHAYAAIVADLNGSGQRVPDFDHARDLHMLLDAVERSATEGRTIAT